MLHLLVEGLHAVNQAFQVFFVSFFYLNLLEVRFVRLHTQHFRHGLPVIIASWLKSLVDGATDRLIDLVADELSKCVEPIVYSAPFLLCLRKRL
jgi:hypothetical protein